MNKLTLLYILLSVCICTASFFILRHTAQPIKAAQKTIIGSYLLGATYTEYNAQGLIKTKMRAEKITRFYPEGNSIFQKPLIITYAADRTPWHIRADSGESDRTGEKIILQGHVMIHELPSSAHSAITITTTALTLFPKESRAETDEAVTLSRPGTTINGKGFIANLKTGQYELKSESKAIYKP